MILSSASRPGSEQGRQNVLCPNILFKHEMSRDKESLMSSCRGGCGQIGEARGTHVMMLSFLGRTLHVFPGVKSSTYKCAQMAQMAQFPNISPSQPPTLPVIRGKPVSKHLETRVVFFRCSNDTVSSSLQTCIFSPNWPWTCEKRKEEWKKKLFWIIYHRKRLGVEKITVSETSKKAERWKYWNPLAQGYEVHRTQRLACRHRRTRNISGYLQ